MRLKISLKWQLLILGIAGIVFSSIVVFVLAFGLPFSTASRTPQNPEQARSGLPIRLVIPKISVDAAFEYVGLTPQGAMDVPKSPANVAWLSLGPRPGEKGTAVVAGHYGWKDNIPAAFDILYKVQKGDNVYVKDAMGATATFVVREVRTYGVDQDTSEVFGLGDGKAHLNLVTCEGVWNKATKSYSDRLVIFTDKT